LEVKKEEYRVVNGLKVLYLEMNGTIQGMKFVYMGYYYSDAGGSVQLLTYTFQSLAKEVKPDAMEFLNGFDKLN